MVSQHGGGSGLEGSKATLGSGGPSIGNYKGVMLCNRPFAGVQAAANATISATKKSTMSAFRAGIPNEPLGLNPTKKVYASTSPRKKKSAIGKHKKWLRKVQEDRREAEAAKLGEEKEKSRRMERFLKRQEEKRKEVTQQRLSEEGEAKVGGMDEEENSREGEQKSTDNKISSKIDYNDVTDDESDVCGDDDDYEAKCAAADAYESKVAASTPAEVFEEEDDDYDRSLSDTQKAKLKIRNKPAWAYTKEGKTKEDEELEEEEVDDLLDFANNLDFEDFIEDLEVKHALEKLRKRVDELKLTPRKTESIRRKVGRILKPQNVDSRELLEEDGDEVKVRPLTREALEELSEELSKELMKHRYSRKDEDVQSVVSERSILSDAKSLRSVHSARSIAAIRKQIEKRRRKGLGRMDVVREGSVADPSVCEAPVVVVNDSEKAKLSEKFGAERLPYIRRNPAV